MTWYIVVLTAISYYPLYIAKYLTRKVLPKLTPTEEKHYPFPHATHFTFTCLDLCFPCHLLFTVLVVILCHLPFTCLSVSSGRHRPYTHLWYPYSCSLHSDYYRQNTCLPIVCVTLSLHSILFRLHILVSMPYVYPLVGVSCPVLSLD
jgi:hypothetical protein